RGRGGGPAAPRHAREIRVHARHSPSMNDQEASMRTARLLSLCLLSALAIRPCFGAGLSKYKDWASSAEAYFLTQDERARWHQVASDEEAEKFIAAYKAARGKGFEAAVQSRISYADANFKLGKKRGSETLRGKTLVILGPPTRVVNEGGS